MTRVLLVEDDGMVRDMLEQVLTRAGFGVVTAENGEEALREFEANPCDVVVTDLIMPEREGLGTIMALRKARPNLGIIAISGGGRVDAEDYLAFAKRLGAAYTFAKPVDDACLINAINELA